MMTNPDELLGRAVRRLLTGQGTIFLTWDAKEAKYSAAVVTEAGTKHHEADCPLLLVQSTLGTLKRKCCSACQESKPLTSFARAGESEEARAAACLACERQSGKRRRQRRA